MQTKDNLLVSIVIPTLQEEKYIGSLLSKLANINKNVEIIVVDGGSTDKTVEIARSFTDKVFILRERGIGRARNYGAGKASGDIIIFVDADMDLPDNFLKKVLSAFIGDRRVVGLTCTIMPRDPLPHEITFFRLYNLAFWAASLIKPHLRGQFLAVRRDAFMKVGGFREDLPCCEDHDLAFRLSRIGRVIFLKDLIVYESMRRFRGKGLLNVLKTWARDYMALLIMKRTISRSWEPVR